MKTTCKCGNKAVYKGWYQTDSDLDKDLYVCSECYEKLMDATGIIWTTMEEIE